jgi:hypothetical protein
MFGMGESQSTFHDDERRSDGAGFEAALAVRRNGSRRKSIVCPAVDIGKGLVVCVADTRPVSTRHARARASGGASVCVLGPQQVFNRPFNVDRQPLGGGGLGLRQRP